MGAEWLSALSPNSYYKEKKMIVDCQDKIDELVSLLENKGYDEEIQSVAKELSKMIADWDKQNPDNVPKVRDVTGKEEDKEEEDYSEMDEKDMRKSMKKGGIIIEFQGK